MKRLVVSLLRLGDIFMAGPALSSLKSRFPGDELHLMVNDEFKMISGILPCVDKFHYFPRKRLQDSLADTNSPILCGFDMLEDFIAPLNLENFDEVYNFTHNILSANVVASIRSQSKFGLFIDESGAPRVNGEWFRMLNQPAEVLNHHFSEIFLRSTGDDAFRTADFFCPNVPLEPKKYRIVLQPFSNEKKKTWSAANWKVFLQVLSSSKKNLSFTVLGAPFEKSSVEQFISEVHFDGLNIEPYICSLEMALQMIHGSLAIVTVDTSIKHLATSTNTKIIELALGSSNPTHTGPFVKNALVLSYKADCFPCSHSVECERAKHECGLNLSGEFVAVATECFLKDQLNSLKALHSREPRYQSFLTSVTSCGRWTLLPIHKQSPKQVVDRLMIDFLSSDLDEVESSGTVGSRAFEASELLRQQIPKKFWMRTAALISTMEKKCENSFVKAEEIQRTMSHLLRTSLYSEDDFKDLTLRLFEVCENEGILKGGVVVDGNLISLPDLARVKEQLIQLKKKNEMGKKFLRTIKLQMMEW